MVAARASAPTVWYWPKAVPEPLSCSASTGAELGQLPHAPGDQMDLFFPELARKSPSTLKANTL